MELVPAGPNSDRTQHRFVFISVAWYHHLVALFELKKVTRVRDSFLVMTYLADHGNACRVELTVILKPFYG